MLLKNKTFTLRINPLDSRHNLFKVKLVVDEVIDVNDVARSIETYGVQLENVEQEFIDYVVQFGIGEMTKELIIANPLFGIPLNLEDLQRKIIFVDEGKNNLRMFLK